VQVQAGVGRTGRWWGHEHLMDSDPDILVFAKGIASGFPLAGIATKEDMFKKLKPGSIGGTYSGNTLGYALTPMPKSLLSTLVCFECPLAGRTAGTPWGMLRPLCRNLF